MNSYDAIVRYSETGGRKTSSMATIANYFQDCAILQSEEVGIGLDYLAEHNRAWFLISWQIEVDRYPVDTESMRQVKIDQEVAEAYPMEPAIDMEYAPRKIKLWDEYTKVDTRHVMSYQIDSNNHMNNEAYIALAQEYVEDITDITAVRAEYKMQYVKDDVIVVKRARDGKYVQILLCDEEDRVKCVVQFELRA